ncbi:hypothetical protein [Leptospira bandrabouensis]|uniref:hypothetical protein n=1 Tax=Leptospira bandrabouensis TaxID=2484903 RepID=UPI001EE86F84|nr:hypothetical protein [Leptospira bandrabouensis]MCG6146568.1 hypothetical protein [Leptospira bandrabouensis]MCG6161981.1 hypothetical protein [Leptospira bandrabouensis]MCG6166165.1 hypothetical protein [Leptospira bandrabouensis]
MNFETFRAYVEIGYFVAGIITSIGIIIAFIQLIKSNEQLKISHKLLKTSIIDIELRSKRESITIALEQSDKLKERLSKLSELEFSQKFKYYSGPLNGFESNLMPKEGKLWLEENLSLYGIEDFLSQIEHILEHFSSYFVSQLADENTAFIRSGEIYTVYFKSIYPYLVSDIDEKNKERKNVFSIRLFNLWNEKIEVKEIKEQILKLQSELNQKELREDITPIGTKFE